jgi:outer membrane protein
MSLLAPSLRLLAVGVAAALLPAQVDPVQDPQPAAVQPAAVQPAAPQPAAPPPSGSAQDPKPAAELPIPVDAEADHAGAPVQAITIEQALRLARGGNVALQAAALLPQQARMDLLFQEAAFVPELYGSSGFAESKRPARNFFAPSVTTQTLDAQVGWRQRVVTGGLFDLAFVPTRFDSSGSEAFPDTQYTSEWTASYRQPLLRGGWSDYATAPIDAARHQVNQSDQAYERSVQDTLLQVVQGYWELVFARENWRVQQTALAVAIEQLRITEERIRVQALAPRDRVADEAEVARRREQLINAENAIRAQEDAVRQLLFGVGAGEAWRTNVRPSSPIAVPTDVAGLQYEPLVEVALSNRPDVRSLRSAIAAAEFTKVQADRDTLPDLDLIGGYSSDGVRNSFRDAYYDATDQQFPDWSVRLEFSLPFGNQAARSRALRAKLEVERQRRLLQAAVLDVTRQVRDAVRSLQTLAQSIQASSESVRLATVNLDTERRKLQVGSSTAFEVQRRNQDLLEARTRLLRNQLDFRTAQSRLLHAQGLLKADAE